MNQKPLLSEKVISKAIGANPAPIPADHLAIITDWQQKTNFGGTETNLDGSFITGILCPLLGYDEVNASGKWTIQKNTAIQGSGNVDVGIGQFSSDGTTTLVAPFELKGPKTKDLDAIMPGRYKSPVQQAWGYAMDTKGAKWVLVSNMMEIRLYAVGYGRQFYEVFRLISLSDPREYARFILILSAKGLLGGGTADLLAQSELADKDITNRLYQDYKKLRSDMIQGLKKNNPALSVENAIRYAQTILDRVLFIAFAEDTKLLPQRSLADAFLTENDYATMSVWERFVALFSWVDKGFPKRKIPPYNGGLFKEDKAIDGLVVPDALCEGFKKLGEYDFASDISVNILGHIFEQSITDLEEIKARLADAAYDSKQGKRKKDGVYYTPDFITRYIVEQSVGGWLEDRRQDLGFYNLPVLDPEKDYPTLNPSKKMAQSAKLEGGTAKTKKHLAFWQAYKDVLANIKVLDPACGSGAFLVQTFDYLLEEGARVNAEIARLKGGVQDIFERLDTHILKNNLFGVDLNSESVEITKLSLWLKTASSQEKLTYLDDNIKCGNSLIDDPSIASDTAFSWKKEFASIFKEGGFDVIVGNPPYGAALSESDVSWLAKRYKSFEYQVNTYVLFYEMGIGLLKKSGILGYITPATFTYQHYFQKIRGIVQELEIRCICKYSFAVFEDADIGDTVSFVIQNSPRHNKTTSILLCLKKEDASNSHVTISYNDLVSKDGIYNLSSDGVLTKIYENSEPLGQCADLVVGIKPYQTGKGVPKQTSDIVEKKPFTANHQVDQSYKLCLIGSNFHRYAIIDPPRMWLKYGAWLAEPRDGAPFFDKEKIVVRQTADRIIAHLDDSKSVNLNNVYNVGNIRQGLSIKYLLGVLNSNLIKIAYRAISQEKGKLFAEVKKVYLEKLPIKIATEQQQLALTTKVDIMLSKNKELFNETTKFLALLKSEFGLDKPGTNLEQWYSLDFPAFIVELRKKKVSLSLKQRAEWLVHFEKERAVAAALKSTIDATDRVIDQLVYALYNLSVDEIVLAENAT